MINVGARKQSGWLVEIHPGAACEVRACVPGAHHHGLLTLVRM